MELVERARCGDLREVMRFIRQQRVDVNAKNGRNETALFVACKHGHNEVAQYLLANGADPNIRVVGGCRELPLHIAAAKDNTELIKLLLKHGANIDATDTLNKTALWYAKKSAFDVLLENKADVNAGGDLLARTVAGGCLDTVGKLLEYGADPNGGKPAGHLLFAACETRNVKLAEMLLKHGADPNPSVEDGSCAKPKMNKFRPIRKLGRNRHREADIPPPLKADDNVSGDLLARTVAGGCLDIVGKLLEYGADPNGGKPAGRLLAAACETGNVKLVEMLLKHGADPNPSVEDCSYATPKIPLLIAAGKGDTDVMEVLLSAGADVNVSLYYAIDDLYTYYRNQPKQTSRTWCDGLLTRTSLIRVLIQRGADVNAPMHGPSAAFALAMAIDTMQCSGYEAYAAELLQLVIEYGSASPDSSSQLTIMADLAAFDYEAHYIVDLLRAGAGLQVIAGCCKDGAKHPRRVWSRTEKEKQKSIRLCLCQAVVLAGYKPSSEEQQKLQVKAARKKKPDAVLCQLVNWLQEESEQVPSLRRQCRVAIRRQLLCARQTTAAIETLPLPKKVKLYMKFDGPLNEIDLSITNKEDKKEPTRSIDSSSSSMGSFSSVDLSEDDL